MNTKQTKDQKPDGLTKDQPPKGVVGLWSDNPAADDRKELPGQVGCHRCPFAVQLAAGMHRNTKYEDTPCAGCRAADKAGFVMELDEARLAGDAGQNATSPPELNERTHLPIDVMRDCVVGLLTLPPDLRDVVAWRFAGLTYPDIAATQGVSTAAVEKRHRRAIELFSGLEYLFKEKTTKKKRRKVHANRAT